MTNSATIQKQFICDVSISEDILTVKSPTGCEINIHASYFPQFSPALKDLVAQIRLMGSGSYGLTKQTMIDLKEVHDRAVNASEVITITPEDIVPIPVVVENEIIFPAVEIRPTYFQAPGHSYLPEFVESPDNKTIANPETGKTYSVVSNRYELLRHEDAVEAVEQVLAEINMTDYERTVKLTDDGVMIAEWDFPKTEHEVQVGDVVSPTLKTVNSYNTSISFQAYFAGKRLVCSNGMTKADKLASYTKKHTKSLDLEAMKKVLIEGSDRFKEQVENWSQWVNVQINQNLLEEIQAVFGKREFVNEVMDLKEISSGQSINDIAEFKVDEEDKDRLTLNPGAVMSAWVAYNIATQFISHHVKCQKKALRMNEKLGAAFSKI